jgi:2'-deoxynucleoside 5'-phosphate N-hydrolase
MIKIYFAGSIRGGREDQEIYKQIIDHLQQHGEVLTEHFAHANLTSSGTPGDVEKIYIQDMAWIEEAAVIVAEVTQPSLGVGYELGRAETMGKKILCLFRGDSERSLSAMITGNEKFVVRTYKAVKEAKKEIDRFFS